AVQHLLTDKRQYQRGETVTFLALLGPEASSESCGRYFVTAAALSPTHRRAYKVILRPFEPPQGEMRAALSHGEPGHSIEGRSVRRCFTYAQQKVGDKFTSPRLIDGIRYDPEGSTAQFVHDRAGRVAMRLPRHGASIALPTPVEQVVLRLELNAR